MNMQSLFYALVMPFIVSASVEFLPRWLYMPITVIGVMVWFGALAIIADGKQK